MADGREELLVATHNAGKLRELMALLADCPFMLVSTSDVEIYVDVEEGGSSLEENATLKATTYARLSARPALADDSGLEVDALGGEPGPLSSRYAGEGASDSERISFLLEKLRRSPGKPWEARFRCVMALAWPGVPVELYSGACRGRIVAEPRGDSGFGYDPIFYLPELGKTMAELSPGEKNRISHRGIAARKVVAALRQKAGVS